VFYDCYVCIEIYTLQLYIIDLTQRGCHTLRLIINTYASLMYELKKMERYLRVNLLGPGPRLMKKEFTGPRSHKG